MKNVLRHARRATAVLGVLSTALAALLGPHGLALGLLVAGLLGLAVAVVVVGCGMVRSVLGLVQRTIDCGDRSDRACRLLLAMRGNDSCLDSAPSAAALGELRPGREVVLNGEMNIVVCAHEPVCEVVVRTYAPGERVTVSYTDMTSWCIKGRQDGVETGSPG
jgi:hypothetical protein